MSLKRKAESDLHHDHDVVLASARASLKKYFPHHADFKPGQQQIITALLRGENAAAIFPTGGGKSLCYQLPGLALKEEGLTLVVSPLLALMKDQVDTARSMNHPVDLLASSLKMDERIDVIRRVKSGQTAILYVAPEQLNNEASVALIKSKKLALVAIDEAHCISEWGSSFRPDYLRLAKLFSEWRVPRVVALTATATPQVAEDICQGFRIDPSNCVRTAFYRPNLKLHFTPVTSEEEREKELIALIRSQPRGSSTIVYATVQKTTERVAQFLNNHLGLSGEARPYHAGLSQEVRKDTQDWFMATTDNQNDVTHRIVVATIAFGMGVDKSDIRTIIHYNLPKSLEGYAQEIGRAGRDGKESHCHVLICMDDIALLEGFAYCGSPSPRSLEAILRDFFCQPNGELYAVGTERAISHYSMGKDNDVTEQGVRMILAFVDIYHGLIRQTTPRYGLYKVRARDGRPVRQIGSLLRENCDNPAVANALVTFLQTKLTWGYIDVGAAAKSFEEKGVTREGLVLALNRLERSKLLEVVPSQVEHVYHIVKQPENLTELASVEFERFKGREDQELGRIEQVLAFFSADDCHSKILTNHFEGPRGPSTMENNNVFPCGQCPRCLSGAPLQLPKRKDFTIDPALWQLLVNDNCLPRDDPYLLARFALGFKSPRLTQNKLVKHKNFGLFEGAPFQVIMDKVQELLSS